MKRWFENLRARSTITATVYLRTLGRFYQLNDTNPAKILDVAESKAFRDEFIDFVRTIETQGKAGSYIARFKKVLHSWLSYNNVNVKLKVNISDEYDQPTIAKEQIPSKDKLDRILRIATPRGRASIALMAFSGLRPQTLGNYESTDGLMLGDFSEATIQHGEVQVDEAPTILVVRKPLSEARHQYLTFVSEQSLTYIRDYLDQRVKHGETLGLSSPLLGFDLRGMNRNAFLRTTLVTRDIKEAIVKAGYAWRPYVLRAYFDTNMIIAESKGEIAHPYLLFFMGHKGDMEARYSTNKGRLPPDMIEGMREAHKACEPFLSTVAQPLEQSSIVKEAKAEALKSVAKNVFGIDILEIKIARERSGGIWTRMRR